MSRHILDARNLLCPMPVIRTQDRVKTLNAGDILEVRCTDPGALTDVPAWCRVHGPMVLEPKEDVDEVVIILSVQMTSPE